MKEANNGTKRQDQARQAAKEEEAGHEVKKLGKAEMRSLAEAAKQCNKNGGAPGCEASGLRAKPSHTAEPTTRASRIRATPT